MDVDKMDVDTTPPPPQPPPMQELDAFGADVDVGATADAVLDAEELEDDEPPSPPSPPDMHPPKLKTAGGVGVGVGDDADAEPTSPVSPNETPILSNVTGSSTFAAAAGAGVDKAFSVANTDSDGSVPPPSDDAVETLDSDGLAELDVPRTTALKMGLVDPDEEGAVAAGLTRALQTQAVELCVEGRMPRGALQAPRPLLVVLFLRGASPGSWAELDRTEALLVPAGAYRWVHKMRLPAATTLDRSEHIALCVYAEGSGEEASNLTPATAVAGCMLRVAQILAAPQMALDVELASPRSGRVRGMLHLAADLIPHRAHDELLTLDVGFEADAPARNRICFVVSRAIPKGRWSPVYRSEVRTRSELDQFRPAVLTNRELNSANDKRLIRIEFYRFYKNRTTTLLGFCQTSLLSLRTCVLGAPIYWWPAQDGIPDAKVVLMKRSVTEVESKFVLRIVPAGRKVDA